MLKDQLVNVFIEEYSKFLVDYQLLVVVMSVSLVVAAAVHASPPHYTQHGV